MRKRVLTCLLLLVLTVVIVSADEKSFQVSTTIELSLKHGFVRTENASSLQSYSSILSSPFIGDNSENISLDISTAQPAGHYVIATNLSTPFIVALKVYPLEHTTVENVPKIPYVLSSTVARFSHYEEMEPLIWDLGSTPSLFIGPVEKAIAASISGLTDVAWAVIDLSITVDSTAIGSTGLLAGSYAGSIVATFTTH